MGISRVGLVEPVEETWQTGYGVVTHSTPAYGPANQWGHCQSPKAGRKPSDGYATQCTSPVSLEDLRAHGLKVDLVLDLLKTRCEEHILGPAGADTPHLDS